AEQDYVVFYRLRGCAVTRLRGKGVAGDCADTDDACQGDRADAVEIVLQQDAGGGCEEHGAGPGEDPQLGMEGEDFAALARDQRVGARIAELRAEGLEL